MRMDVVLLILLWLLLGLLAGGLAHLGRLGLAARGLGGEHAGAATVALGAGAGLLGGALGWLVFGRFFAVPTALWVSGLAVTAGPWLAVRLRDRRRGASGAAGESR